jgi:hypothetical protein
VRQMIDEDWTACERCGDFAPVHYDSMCLTCHEDMAG